MTSCHVCGDIYDTDFQMNEIDGEMVCDNCWEKQDPDYDKKSLVNGGAITYNEACDKWEEHIRGMEGEIQEEISLIMGQLIMEDEPDNNGWRKSHSIAHRVILKLLEGDNQ